MHDYYDFGFGIGHISMMLLWIFIIGFVIWTIFSSKETRLVKKESHLHIAKWRYARGEISQKELDEIKTHL